VNAALSADITYNADATEGFVVNSGNAAIQIGADGTTTLDIHINDMSDSGLGVDSAQVDTADNATSAISAIDTAIAAVSTQRAKLGAYQNRLEHTIANLGTTIENLTSAESRVKDVDMALEMADFTKGQILQQAGTAMLAQANAAPQTVMQLLRA
jgi:flagellin